MLPIVRMESDGASACVPLYYFLRFFSSLHFLPFFSRSTSNHKGKQTAPPLDFSISAAYPVVASSIVFSPSLFFMCIGATLQEGPSCEEHLTELFSSRLLPAFFYPPPPPRFQCPSSWDYRKTERYSPLPPPPPLLPSPFFFLRREPLHFRMHKYPQRSGPSFLPLGPPPFTARSSEFSRTSRSAFCP